MSNPTFPVSIPNNNGDAGPQVDGDQKMLKAVDGNVMLSHNGGHYPSSERPGNVGGTVTKDLYAWAEE